MRFPDELTVVTKLESLLAAPFQASSVAALHKAVDEIEDLVTSAGRQLGGLPYVAPNAEVHPSAVLGDRVILLSGSSVGPYSYLRRDVILGAGAQIGFAVELDRILISSNTKVMHHACVGRSLVGPDCNLGFGFVAATKRLDSQPVQPKISPSERGVASSVLHHGFVMGSKVRSGVNVSVMPGATICPNATLPPNSSFAGYVD